MCEPTKLGERCTGHMHDQLEAAQEAYDAYVAGLPAGVDVADDETAQVLATAVQRAKYRHDATPMIYENRRNAILPPPIDVPDEIMAQLQDAINSPEVKAFMEAAEAEQAKYQPNTQTLNVNGELKSPLTFDANQVELFHLDEAAEYTKWREDTAWMLDDVMDFQVKDFIKLNKDVFTAEIARCERNIQETLEARKEIVAVLNGEKECGVKEPHDHRHLEEAYVITFYQIERWKERQKYSELKVLDLEELAPSPRW